MRKEAQAKEISRLLCAKENEIADAVAHLAEETNQLKYELAEKERRLVKAYADMISESKDAVCIFTEEFGGDSMRMLMNYVLDAGHCICAVFFGNEKTGIDMCWEAVNKMYVKWRKSLIKDSTDAAAENPRWFREQSEARKKRSSDG